MGNQFLWYRFVSFPIGRRTMKYQASNNLNNGWPRVWGVDDPSIIDLTDSSTAIEWFVNQPDTGYHHVLRFIVEIPTASGVVSTEGILLGASSDPERPRQEDWSGQSDNLKVLSYIDLGTVHHSGSSDLDLDSDGINDDPIIFLNFDPQTTTALFMNSDDCVPELVRERLRGYRQEH